MVCCVWCAVYGVLCMVCCVWCAVYGVLCGLAWCAVYDVLCMVCCVWCAAWSLLVHKPYMCHYNNSPLALPGGAPPCCRVQLPPLSCPGCLCFSPSAQYLVLCDGADALVCGVQVSLTHPDQSWGRWRELGTVEGAIDVCFPLTELPVGGQSARSLFTHHTRHIPPSPLSHTHHHFTRPHLQGIYIHAHEYIMNSASTLISFRKKPLSKQSSCQC